MIDSLTDYTIRYSKKAKYLQLRVLLHGLEIIIPEKKRISTNAIEEFIREKRRWIDKHSQRLQSNQRLRDNIIQELPTSINLKAIAQEWGVVYLKIDQPHITLMTNPSKQVTLIGDISQAKLCQQKLQRWLRRQAEHYLYQELINLSLETGLKFNKLTIRNNTSRWGSCSNNQNISLCCKILFLTPMLMRHVLLHELCHTKVLHHGKRFWRLLEKFDPFAREHSRQLNAAAREIPFWV